MILQRLVLETLEDQTFVATRDQKFGIIENADYDMATATTNFSSIFTVNKIHLSLRRE